MEVKFHINTMKRFLIIGGLLAICFSFSASAYDLSAKEKVKKYDKVFSLEVSEAIEHVIMGEISGLEAQGIHVEVEKLEGANTKAILNPEGYWRMQQIQSDPYLHRSQAWIKSNNLFINGTVPTFVSTRGLLPLLC